MNPISQRTNVTGSGVRDIARAIGSLTTSFKINRPSTLPTAPSPAQGLDPHEVPVSRNYGHWNWAEVIAIVICLGLFAGTIPPDVNESHYLTKAKHFWNPNWCPNDIFLSSAHSHWFFYFSCGWLTKFFSLSVTAWIGRLVTWTLLAFAWQRLSRSVSQVPFVSVLSAIAFLVLNERFHLAGEWVVGGFEAKGFAYFFVLLALERIVRQDWKWCWVMLGAASAFHVLVGGWSAIACSVAFVFCGPTLRSERERAATAKAILPFLLGGFLFALIGIVPPLSSELGVSSVVLAEAHEVYVRQRIPHHLYFGSFPVAYVARFLVLTIVWTVFSFLLFRYRKIRVIQAFCLGSLLIAFAGLILSGFAEQGGWLGERSTSLLRLYWFRLADFALPMALALTCSTIIGNWIAQKKLKSFRFGAIGCVVLFLFAAALAIVEKHQEPRPRADAAALPNYAQQPVRTFETFRNWKKACEWIRTNTPTDSVFITPGNQQTFKWYAQRNEIVNWKDVPQDAGGLIEWRKRIEDFYLAEKRLDAGLLDLGEGLIVRAKEYSATHLMVPQFQVDLRDPPASLKRIYPTDPEAKSTYVVYKVMK